MKYLNNYISLLRNTLVVYLLYSVTRLVFLLTNWNLFSETMDWNHALSLFGAGLKFDTTAIIYSNALFVLMFMIPFHFKENKKYYLAVRWIYTIVNSICLYTNLIDCVYFQYTGKRTTCSVINEFGNEGAGNMAKIFGEQILANWYLFLIAIAITWVLWKLFRAGGFKHRESLWRRERDYNLLPYYVINTLLLAITLPLCLGGARGGFTTAVRPITISNANQYASTPSEAGLVLNTPFSLMRTIGKKPLVTPDYMPEKEAEALFSPIHEPADSVAFKPMNVVVLIMESFGMQHVGFYNGGDGRTPFLDSLISTSAMTFRHSFANGRKSIEGMPSVLSSLPNYVEPFFLTPASLNDLSGLARELSENKGYTSAFFHGAENGSMGFEAFAKSTGFQKYYGRTEYNQDPNYNGDGDYDGTWAIWDEEFMQFYADRMSEMKEPFVTSVFTATSHTPFALPERYKGMYDAGNDPMEPCIEYSDNALRQFFNKAKKQKWFSNTLFVITADHTSHHYKPFYKTEFGHYYVPIVFYAPNDTTLHGYDTHQIVEQIDIMPSVLSYIGYDKPYIGFGRNVLNCDSISREQGIALHWVPGMNGYEYVEGDYVLEFDGEKVTQAYKFRTDSTLSHNILSSMPKDKLSKMEKKMKAFIQQYMGRMNENKLMIKK
ncbi:MAG: LTA synthase family protein [Prevotellaceae bacterium]|nr:LTA synthase family protein [Candidatus Minthosoma caballi]